MRFRAARPSRSSTRSAPATSLEAACYRAVRRHCRDCAGEIERRYPKVLRRVGGYNLDAFVDPTQPFNLAKLMVGSEGTLGVVLEAKVELVPLPKAKAVLAIQFADLLEALEATPAILAHGPSAVEVMDRFILDNTKQSAGARAPAPDVHRRRSRGAAVRRVLRRSPRTTCRRASTRSSAISAARGFGYRYHRAIDPAAQATIWACAKRRSACRWR